MKYLIIFMLDNESKELRINAINRHDAIEKFKEIYPNGRFVGCLLLGEE